MNAKDFLELIEGRLEAVLEDCEGETGEAMRYAVLGGGKRVRPLCVYYGAKAVCPEIDDCLSDLITLGVAIELIHNYSLVHDDMPEMDNDDYRRGKLSVHKKFGVATALLTGDALLTMATKQLLLCQNRNAAAVIADAAMNMVYGQSAEFEGCRSKEEYLAMYAKKTGALICGAFVAGAICVSNGEGSGEIAAVTGFAKHLGLAFQLADDLIDDGASIADLIGREETSRMLDEESEAAIEIASSLNCSSELVRFAEQLWKRKE